MMILRKIASWESVGVMRLKRVSQGLQYGFSPGLPLSEVLVGRQFSSVGILLCVCLRVPQAPVCNVSILTDSPIRMWMEYFLWSGAMSVWNEQVFLYTSLGKVTRGLLTLRQM